MRDNLRSNHSRLADPISPHDGQTKFFKGRIDNRSKEKVCMLACSEPSSPIRISDSNCTTLRRLSPAVGRLAQRIVNAPQIRRIMLGPGNKI
jgi:hypothetical protein